MELCHMVTVAVVLQANLIIGASAYTHDPAILYTLTKTFDRQVITPSDITYPSLTVPTAYTQMCSTFDAMRVNFY